jgi:hypothetical protein
MKRIGVAASKMARGDVFRYNLWVVIISCLFSLFIFIIVGSTIIFSLVVIAYVGNGITPLELQKGWGHLAALCMVTLTVLITVLNLLAILINIKLPFKSNNDA